MLSRPSPPTTPGFRAWIVAASCAAMLLTSLGNEGFVRPIGLEATADAGDRPVKGHPVVDLLQSRDLAAGVETLRPTSPAATVAVPLSVPVPAGSAATEIPRCAAAGPPRHALFCVWVI